ncbi:hypothetical protein [Zobellia amurskyensis]|uniref:hypothetical protein n=1 Tax=Zobellia amurskyensis TaxID=248905 RepID=UPI00141218AE|nr:hypothetical protein [Zobellia amurskyensis]
MNDNTIFIILGVVAVIYVLTAMNNRRQSKSRKNRKFMDSYERKKKVEEKEDR